MAIISYPFDDENFLDKIKHLAENDLLTMGFIYRELKNSFLPTDSDNTVMNIIRTCWEFYLVKDQATINGVTNCARDIMNNLRKTGSINSFDYKLLSEKYYSSDEYV